MRQFVPNFANNSIGNILEKLEMSKLIFFLKKKSDNYSEYYFCLSVHKCLKTIDQGCISDSFTVKMWKP